MIIKKKTKPLHGPGPWRLKSEGSRMAKIIAKMNEIIIGYIITYSFLWLEKQ